MPVSVRKRRALVQYTEVSAFSTMTRGSLRFVPGNPTGSIGKGDDAFPKSEIDEGGMDASDMKAKPQSYSESLLAFLR